MIHDTNLVRFKCHFKDDLSSQKAAEKAQGELESRYGVSVPVYETPVVFSRAEVFELDNISRFWANLSRKINSKLKRRDEQLLETFPEYKHLNDSAQTKFEIPPFMRLDTLIDETGTPKIIECNALFPGGLGFSPIQNRTFLDELNRPELSMFSSLEDVNTLLSQLSTNGRSLTFVEEPQDSYHAETEIFGDYLAKLGFQVSYRTSDEDLSDETGNVVKRVIRKNDSLERRAMDGKISLANPLWSSYLNDKGLLALLRDNDFTREFEDDLVENIQKYVADSRYLGSLSPDERRIIVESKKNDYTHKSVNDYAGNGVSIGSETSSEEWSRLIRSNNQAIIQSTITSSNHNGNPYDIGIVMLGGKFSHPKVRVSTQGSLKTNVHLGAKNAMYYYE